MYGPTCWRWTGRDKMKWRVMVELGGAEGTVELHEVSVGGGTTTEYSAETLGLTIAEGNTALAGLQRHLVQAQTEEHCRTDAAASTVARNARSRTSVVGN